MLSGKCAVMLWGDVMNTAVVMAFFAFFSGALGWYGAGGELIQGKPRSWRQAAFGLRSSISVETMHISRGGPFVVSVIIENVSGTRIDLKTISAFHLTNSSKSSPESTLAFGGYWCPINPADKNPALHPGLILAFPSRLVMEKGTSVSATMDLTRHGWERSASSWWPARDFDSVVGPGKYVLRLDIQVGPGTEPKWIRSNEVEVMIGNPESETIDKETRTCLRTRLRENIRLAHKSFGQLDPMWNATPRESTGAECHQRRALLFAEHVDLLPG